MKIVYQGEAYEDPNPPEEDEKTKKKGKDPNEPDIRMITPDPILLEGEMGREFSFELGRYEEVRIEKDKTKTPEASMIELQK